MAGFNLISLLLVFIRDKKFDLAILMVLGANTKLIMCIMLFLSLIITLIGIVIGDLLSVVVLFILSNFLKLPQDMYYFSKLPFFIKLDQLILINFAVIVLTIMSVILPMKNFLKRKLVDSLKYE